MKGLAAFVMAGRGQAVLAVVAFSLLSVVIPPASYLAGGAVGLVTLRRGWLEGLFVTAGATLLAGAGSCVKNGLNPQWLSSSLSASKRKYLSSTRRTRAPAK